MVLCVGTLELRKGQDILLKAVPEILKDIPNVIIIIAGLGKQEDVYIKLARDLKIEGIVWDKINPYVIINGLVVREGEEIFGYEVVKIEERQVTLSEGIEVFILKLR